MSQWPRQIRRAVHPCWPFLKHLSRRFFQDGCQESAAALTYMTLFALVPMLTLVFTILSFIPDFQGLEGKLQTLIFNNFLPEAGTDVQGYLTEFTSQARKLSWFGVAILVVTAYLMLVNIEKTFNKIWGTAGGRKGLSSFLLYWAILSLGPLLVGVGLWMNAYLLSYQWLVDEYDTLGLMAVLFQFLPLILTWAAASLLFVAVPNCRVRVRYALIGGLVTTLLFEVLKAGFGVLVANSSYHLVYGAFAAVPLFLLWIYSVWTLLLIGAELVRALETFKTAVQGYTYPNLVAALVILYEAHRRQQSGEGVADRDVLRVGIEQQHWQQLRDLLLANSLLVITASGRYMVARDLSQVTLAELVALFGEHFTALPSAAACDSLEPYRWFGGLSSMLGQCSEQTTIIMSTTVGELFDGKS